MTCAFVDGAAIHNLTRLLLRTTARLAVQFTISEKLPKLQYQTLADQYISMSFAFLYTVVLINAVDAILIETIGMEAAKRFDRLMFIIIGVVYVSVHGLWFIRLKRYKIRQQLWEKTRAPYSTLPQQPTMVASNGDRGERSTKPPLTTTESFKKRF